MSTTTTPLTPTELRDLLMPHRAGTVAILATADGDAPVLRRDFTPGGAPELGVEHWDWDVSASGYLDEFGPIFSEHPEPVIYGVVRRRGATILTGSLASNDDTEGFAELHRALTGIAGPGDVVFFGYPHTKHADLTVALVVNERTWRGLGCTYADADLLEAEELFTDVTAVRWTAYLDLDWNENAPMSATPEHTDRTLALLGVSCDNGDCVAYVGGDYVVRVSDDTDTRLGYVLDHAAHEGWLIKGRNHPQTARTFCPAHRQDA